MIRPKLLFRLLILGLFSLSLTGNSSAGSKDKEAVAKVNGEVISKEDFKKKLESMNFVTKDNKEEEQKTKREALDLLITDKLVEQKAKKMDLSQDEEWKRKEEKHSRDYMVELMYKKEIEEKVGVQDSEITEFYEKNKGELYKNPEQYKISHILIEVKKDSLQKGNPEQQEKEADKKALEKIESIYNRIMAGEDFSALAKQYSDEEKTRENGGELGFLPRGMMLKEFEEQVLNLKPGEVSKPFKTKYGYHILKYTEKLPGELMEYNDDLRNRIKYTISKEKQKKKVGEYLDSLKSRTNYLYNEEVLNQTPEAVEDDPWVLIIENQDTVRFSKYKSDLEPYRAYLKKDSLDLEDKKKLLRDYSSIYNILVIEGKREGYDKLPEYTEEMNKFRLKEAEKRVLAGKTLKPSVPSDEEVSDYYLSHLEEFPPDSSIHVYHIIFNDSLKAEEVLKKIQEGADFVEMAKEYYPGEKEIRDVAYDLGFISEKDISPEFYKTAARLQVGEVSHPVKTEWGYHIIKLVERRSDSPVIQYKDKIKILINQEKQKKAQAEWEKSLKEGEEIWVNEKSVKKFKMKPENVSAGIKKEKGK
jgi:parvulin-like peptidyl-prolyl isomerase